MRFSSLFLSVFLLSAVTMLPLSSQAQDTGTRTVASVTQTKVTPAKASSQKAKAHKATKRKQAVRSTPEEAKMKLATLANKKMTDIQSCLRPCKTKMDIVKTDSGYVARYIEVDPKLASVDVREADSPGTQYVGIITYYERFYESKGLTEAQAVAGTFNHVKTRRMREMHRYDQGKWFD